MNSHKRERLVLLPVALIFFLLQDCAARQPATSVSSPSASPIVTSLGAANALPQGIKAGVYDATSQMAYVATLASGSDATQDNQLLFTTLSIPGGVAKTMIVPSSDPSVKANSPVVALLDDGSVLIGAGRSLFHIQPTTESVIDSDTIPNDISPLPSGGPPYGAVVAVRQVGGAVDVLVFGSTKLLSVKNHAWSVMADLPISAWLGSDINVAGDGTVLVGGNVGSEPNTQTAVASVTATGDVKLLEGVSACPNTSAPDVVCLDGDQKLQGYGSTSQPVAANPPLNLVLHRDLLTMVTDSSEGLWYWHLDGNGASVKRIDSNTGQTETAGFPLKSIAGPLHGTQTSASSSPHLNPAVQALVPTSSNSSIVLTSGGATPDGSPPNYSGAYLVTL